MARFEFPKPIHELILKLCADAERGVLPYDEALREIELATLHFLEHHQTASEKMASELLEHFNRASIATNN